MPKISIVVATFNAEPVLEKCLRSIANQNSTDWELIVIDGGSTDGTKTIIEANSGHIAYWHSKPDAGIYDAWNQALTHVSGEYICFLGADDTLHSPESLSEISNAIGGETYDLVTCRGRFINDSGAIGQVIGTSWADAKLPFRIGVCHPGLLHHRSLFRRYGLFNAKYKIAGDLDFLLRLPSSAHSLDLPKVTVDVLDGGISRNQYWRRIKERRHIHATSPRVGPVKAWLYWADKAWRRPIALLFGLPN